MPSSVSSNIVDDIKKLCLERRAVILAHNYQLPDVQDIADQVGDSLALSQTAATTDADVIVFCGVHFMAETAALLAPTKTVLLPDLEAGCSLASTADAETVRAWKIQHPDAVVVAYVNTTAAVKAEADYCCTSSNAVAVVQSIPADKEILFLPDMYLGQYVRQKTGRIIHLWPGSCHVHFAMRPEDLERRRAEFADAEFLVHPECGCLSSALAHADVITSTSGMVKHVRASVRERFLVATETGILHTLRQENPHKTFVPLLESGQCEFMKKITLEKILWSLQKMKHQIRVPEEIARRARRAIQRMVEIV